MSTATQAPARTTGAAAPAGVPVDVGGARARVLALRATREWRQDPQVHALVAAAVADLLGAPAPDEVAGRAARAVLVPGSHLLPVAARPGSVVGVSASHEAGRTYVAVAPSPVAVDACALDRWREVDAVAADTLTADERAALRTPWDRARVWTALECAVKAGRADLLRPHARAALTVPGVDGPVVPGDGVGLHLVHHAGRLRAVCVRVAAGPVPAAAAQVAP